MPVEMVTYRIRPGSFYFMNHFWGIPLQNCGFANL